MRYLFAITSGALLAILPALLLMMPDLAWWSACRNFVESVLIPQALDAVIENPCGMTHRRPDETIWVGVLYFGIVAIGCVVSGALAARMAEERRFVFAFFAPFLGYVVLLLWGAPHVLAFVVGMFAGLLGMVGVGWQYLTNAWRATRSKQRAQQA